LSNICKPAAARCLDCVAKCRNSHRLARRWFHPQFDGRLGIAALLAEKATAVSSQAWSIRDIDAGIAWVVLATQEQFVPQMANMELIGAVSFKKGCYPGQEIVARTQYLGKLKRRLFKASLAVSARG
jgi:folate-binding protein YgfZ